ALPTAPRAHAAAGSDDTPHLPADFSLSLPSSGASTYMKTRAIEAADLKGGGYLALPESEGRHPGVAVIHEAYGLNDNIKDITRRLSHTRYAALAVDLFTDRGNWAICMARYMTGMLIGSVDRAGIGDLKTALSYLAAVPEV